MFSGCNKLKVIKGIEQFNTNKVEKMDGMFKDCKGLQELDLLNFNISKVINMKDMFSGCNLKIIKGIEIFNKKKAK